MDGSRIKAREEPNKPERSSSADKVELQQYSEAPKVRDFADPSYRSFGADVSTIVEPKKDAVHKSSSMSREDSKPGRSSRNPSKDDSGRSPTLNSQSLQLPGSSGSNAGRSGSPIVDFMADSILPHVPRRSNSVTSSQGFDQSSSKKSSKSVSQKLKGFLSPTKGEQSQKCPWDLSLLQDRSGKQPACEMPERWMRLCLPGSKGSDDEYVRWPGSDIYTLDEKHEWPFPMAAYLYGSIPPRPRGYESRQFMLIFRVTSHNDPRTEGQAEHFLSTIRFLEGKLALSVNVEFDEEKDRELSKTEHQRAIKDMLEKTVRKATSTAPKKVL